MFYEIYIQTVEIRTAYRILFRSVEMGIEEILSAKFWFLCFFLIRG